MLYLREWLYMCDSSLVPRSFSMHYTRIIIAHGKGPGYEASVTRAVHLHLWPHFIFILFSHIMLPSHLFLSAVTDRDTLI